jgi:SNF2 family DNA or RNA helicase
MSDVLHATWLPTLQRLFLWGESGAGVPRKGRKAQLPVHPFQTPVARLREIVGPHVLPLPAEHTLSLWLPSSAAAPFASPELLATGAQAPPEGQPQLAAWRVTGLLLTPGQALDLLLAAPVGLLGADLRAWRVAALLAIEVLSGQQLVPGLQREGFRLRAAWLPRPTPATADKLAALAQALPPLCRAAADDPAAAPRPRALLDDFLAAVVDASIRAKPFEQPREIETRRQGDKETRRNQQTISPSPPLLVSLSRQSPGGKWLAALLGDDPILDLRGPEADALYKAWQAWAGQAQVAGDDVFRITFRLEPPDRADDPWALAFLLRAADDPSLIVPAAQIWRERGATFKYLDRRFEHPQERLLAGLGYAARVFPPLEASLHQQAPDRAQLSAQDAFTFLKEAAPLLEGSGFGILVPGWWQGRSARLQARARAKGKGPGPNGKSLLSFEALVSFNWELTLGGAPISRAEFERLAALKQPLVQLRGQWVVLDPEQIAQALKFFDRRDGDLSLADALQLGLGADGQALPAGVEFAGLEAEGWLKGLLEQLNNAQTIDLLPPPKELRGELRPYQARGVSWMMFLRRFGLGACLADDMGLGKTISTIALLLDQRERLGVKQPALIVCPTSVVGNWQREIARFAPSLRVMIHRGSDRQTGAQFGRATTRHDVVLTSFPLLARDRETLAELEWGTLVLDEAQNIKNASTKQAQAARALKAAGRIALTGTPVENRLSELWSILTFLNPGYLGSEESFRREYARPIERTGDKAAAERLRKLTGPFVLRRLKTDPTIIADLPEKQEMKVYCPLTQEQATLYEAVVREALEKVEQAEAEGDSMSRRGQVLAMLMQLKQVCNHPAQFAKDGSDVAGRSGKLARLSEMLEEIYATDDRALVFTQFAQMGEMLRTYLRETFYDEVLFLHGGTPAKERDPMVRRFQAPNGPRVFILSLKAGGTGLNLTAANHVFHFDRWWNPAVENQATDRAFRIGQRRDVQVRKLVCVDTIEERIDDMLSGKRQLAELTVGAGENWITELSTDELRTLFALGAAAVGD